MSDIEAFAGLCDLASRAVGGEALLCSDDFFAGMEHLVDPKPAAFDPAAYTDRGKLMDGWESRRKRVPGHDWCILRLGVPGRIRGVDIDTSFFLGNHPPFARLDACEAPADTAPEALRDTVRWTTILPSVPLKRGSHNLQPIESSARYTHVRLHIYPDGGVARLRIYGDPRPTIPEEGELDLASLVAGARPLACSDMFFSPMSNLLLPGRSTYMGGGWETRRSRPPGMDWLILALAGPGELDRVLLDTGHFKGNYPDKGAIDGLFWPGAPPQALINAPWTEIVPPTRLRADAEHLLPVRARGPWTHLRLRVYPDGGVARLRAFGRRSSAVDQDPLLVHLRGLGPDALREALTRCCGATRWVEGMMAARPFASRAQLLGEAEQIWWHLGDGDWREAFTHHPRIGEDAAALRARFSTTASWSSGEQAGMQAADEATITALADGNRAYFERFGFIFIVCATGLSAAEMRERLEARIDNEPWAELRHAAGEQVKITALRLQKLGVS